MTWPILPCELAMAAVQADPTIRELLGDRITHAVGFDRSRNRPAFDTAGLLQPSATIRQGADPGSAGGGLYHRVVEVTIAADAEDGNTHLAVQRAASRIRAILSGDDLNPRPLIQSTAFPEFAGRPILQLQFQYQGGGPVDARQDILPEYSVMIFTTGTTT